MIALSPFQMSVIIGVILSDGWLTIPRADRKNARLGFKQSLAHSNYVWYVFNLLSHYCSNYPQLVRGVRQGKPLFGLQFFTRVLPCFTVLHDLFYVNKIKIVPDNIYDLLTPPALAHLIQGDGSRGRHGLIICTNSFTVQDIVKLINVLIIRYGLKCSIHTKKNKKVEYMIYISESSMAKLREIVLPYTCSSMYYKLRI